MSLRHLVPIIAASAAALPATQALEISEGAVQLSIGIRLQSRIDFASASDAAGDDWDIYEGVTTEDPKQVNFYLRRARLYLKGKYKENTRFELTFYQDDIGMTGRSRSSETSNSSGGQLAVRYAWVAHDFTSDDIKHTVQFGLDKPQLIAGHTDSSSKHLFPNGRTIAELKEVDRKIGLEYALSAPIFQVWVGYYEADVGGSDDDRNDAQFSIRVETSFKEEWKTRRSESYLGKEGFHHILGAGIGVVTDGGEDEDGATIFTVDYLAHWDQLTALAEILLNDPEEDGGAGAGLGISAQAGWAFPLENGTIVEPALRLALIDNQGNNDDETDPYEEEGGQSGTYIDAGVNIYFDGHDNKLQIALTSFTAEEGDADAFIFRIGHQLDF